MAGQSDTHRSRGQQSESEEGISLAQTDSNETIDHPPRRPASHHRAGYFFFVVSIIGVAAIALLLYARSMGSLRVRVLPRDAVIVVDGEERGRGDTELRFLRAGTYRIEAQLGGLRRERVIRVEPGERRVMNVELRQGFLVARSPSGPAVVEVQDGEEPLGLTPVGPVALWAGPSVLRFSLPGYVERVETVTVAPEETTTVSVELERGRGYVHVEVMPETASVLVDGELVGHGPVITAALAAGEHVVEGRAPGWTTTRESVFVDHGDTLRWAIRLPRVHVGWLSVGSSPTGATVTSSDGTALGTTPVDSVPMDPGARTIRVAKPGFIPEELTVQIRSGSSVSRSVHLNPEHATRPLALNSRPTATVLLDGKMVGETPMVVREVRTGVRHVLTLLSTDGRTWSTEFVVSPREGGAHRISHDFTVKGEPGQ